MEEQYDGTLKEKFLNPPNEFRMMPFWFWNHEMVEKEVVRQIQDHNDHGIGGEFIHPRHGRLTPYMGQRWLENVEAAADKCKELGMPCFLYDEDNWPSGPVGGKITGPDHPENRGKGILQFDEETFDGGAGIVEYEFDLEDFPEEAEFFAALAVPNPVNYPDFSDVAEKVTDVSAFIEKNLLKWNKPEGDWVVLFFLTYTQTYLGNMGGYIDILRKETVGEFIKETHQKYVDHFITKGKKDYLGTVVPGIFTDEPSLSHFQALGGYIKYTPEMPARFREMFGYEFKTVLLSLFFDTGSISAKHRCDYWACTIDMYVNAFYKQIYDFCDKYKWRFTGHINSEGVLPNQIKEHGDFFKVFEYLHYGGCDQLTEEVRPDGIEDFWNVKGEPYRGMARDMILASKFASSAAHLLGKPRVLVEAWGSSSWQITLASAKRVNDYLIATGCDLFVPHSFNYSEDGYRKGDHPAAFDYQPYYTHWKLLADHNARLSAILNANSGVLVPEVLLFYPTKSFHAEMQPHTSLVAEHLGKVVIHNADCLYRQQLDFELANEDMILGGELKGSTFSIRNESFKLLLLGPATCLGLEFARWLLQYYRGGGKILATGVLPFKSAEEGLSSEVVNIITEIFNVNPGENYQALTAGEIKDVSLSQNKNSAGGMGLFIVCPLKSPYSLAYFPVLQEACRKALTPEIREVVLWKDPEKRIHPSYVMATHKRIEGKEYYFFANTSYEIGYEGVKISLKKTPISIELWDTETGKIQLYQNYYTEKGRTILELDFPCYRSYLFVLVPEVPDEGTTGERSVQIYTKKPRPMHSQTLDPKWQFSFRSPNVAMLNKNWTASFEQTANKGWKYRSSRKYSHLFIVENAEAIKPVKVVIEGLVGDYAWGKTTTDFLYGGDRAHFKFPSGCSVSLNGKSVPIRFDFTPEYIDPCWIVADISKWLIEGENVITFESKTNNHNIFHAVSDPWKLIGPFETEERDGVPMLKPPRETVSLTDLSNQGFARYHGPFTYIQRVGLNSELEGKQIHLELPGCDECIEVHINGNAAGVLWHEWDLDITNFIKFDTENEIKLTYYGNAQNMLQTNILPQGIMGDVIIQYY